MPIAPSPTTSVIVRTAIDTLLLMFLFLSIDLLSDWFLSFGSFRSRKRRIDDRQRVLPLNVIHIRNSKYAFELLRRYFHRSWRIRLSRLRLRKRRARRVVERDVAFDLSHRLMDVSVEHRHRAELLQTGERLRAILGSPAPLRIHRPQRNVREHHDGSAVLQVLYVVLQPLQLLVAKCPKSPGFQIHHVDQPDKMRPLLVKAVPTGALAPSSIAFEELFPIVVQ